MKFYRVELILAEYEETDDQPSLKRVHRTHPVSGRVYTEKRFAEGEFSEYMWRHRRT